MFNNTEHFIAIFTQERLANFQIQYPNVTLDYVLLMKPITYWVAMREASLCLDV